MKALVYTGPEQMEVRDEPLPETGENELLVEVAACGICGSDMHGFLGHDTRRPAPLILGHEATGVVADGPRQGERVVINPLVTCQTCPACKNGRENLCASRQIISMPPRPGGFAEYVAIPERNVISVPEHVSFDQAAMVEPIACGWHAVQLAQHIHDRPLEKARCLVIGGGAIGVGAALVLEAMNAGQVTVFELNKDRCAFNSGIGAFAAVDSEENLANEYDIIIDGVGLLPTRQLASKCTAPGGVIAHIGLGHGDGGLDTRRMTLQEVTFIGTYTYSVKDFADTADALFAGRLGKLDWMETRPLEDGLKAFQDIRNGKVSSPKIVLHP